MFVFFVRPSFVFFVVVNELTLFSVHAVKIDLPHYITLLPSCHRLEDVFGLFFVLKVMKITWMADTRVSAIWMMADHPYHHPSCTTRLRFSTENTA